VKNLTNEPTNQPISKLTKQPANYLTPWSRVNEKQTALHIRKKDKVPLPY